MAVVVLALYILLGPASTQFAMPEFLWLLCPLVLFWVTRTWIQTTRGALTADPFVRGMKDRVSLGLLTLALISVALAGTLTGTLSNAP